MKIQILAAKMKSIGIRPGGALETSGACLLHLNVAPLPRCPEPRIPAAVSLSRDGQGLGEHSCFSCCVGGSFSAHEISTDCTAEARESPGWDISVPLFPRGTR